MQSNWTTKKLGEISEIVTGSTPSTNNYDYYGGNILWAGPSDLNGIQYIEHTRKTLTEKGLREGRARLVSKGSILMSCIGYIGKVAIATQDMTTNQQINSFIPNTNFVISEYLYYALMFFKDRFVVRTSQTTLPIINKSKCEEIEIPLPSLEIQKKIVKKIEELFAKIDQAQSLRVSATGDTDNLVPATLSKIFDEGRSKGWKDREFGQLCDLNPRNDIKTLSSDTEVSFIPMKYVDDIGGMVKQVEIRKLGEVKKGYTCFKDNDVLFAKITPCMENGKAAIVQSLKNGIGFGSTEFHVIRSKGDILPELIYYYIRRKSYREEAEKRMTGSAGQKRVPKEFIEKSTIPLPSLVEQKKIVARMDALTQKVRELRTFQSQTVSDLSALKQSILHRAFQGGLVN